MDTAIAYIKQAPEDRKESPVYVINAGHEPPLFSCHFHAWDITKAKDNISKDEASGESMAYLRKLAKLQEDAPKLFRMNSQVVLPKFKPGDIKPEPAPASPAKGSLLPKFGKTGSSLSPSPSSSPSVSSDSLGTNSPSSTSTPGTPTSQDARSRSSTTSRLLDKVGKVGSSVASKFGRKKEDKSGPSIEEDEEGMALALQPTYDDTTLKARPLPPGVSNETMEKHLSNDDFHAFFKMSRKQWEDVPKWKKITIKKSVGLF